MIVGLDISQVQYTGTGVGNYTYHLVKELLTMPGNHQLTLFGGSLRGFSKLKSTADSLDAQTTKIYPLPPSLLEVLFNQFHQPPIEFFTGPIDVFHASDWTQPSAKKAKLITTIHDLTTLKYPDHHHPKTIAAQARRLKWVKREAATIICDSQATKQDVINLLGINPDRLHVVYLAANQLVTDFSQLSQATKSQRITAVKTKYHLHGSYVLSVGTNEPRKNLKRTIAAFKLTDFSGDLVIAGKYGWGGGDTSANSAHIKRLGFVPFADLPALYAGADCFVYPSLYEGFGLPVLEAMALGVPVVTTDNGSLKEVAGSAAILVDAHSIDSIAAGISQAIKGSSRLKTAGIHQAQKFSWQQTAQKTLAIYEQTLVQAH